MDEAIGSATLVEAVPDVEAHGLTTTVPRAEVEEVLRSEDGPIELYLDMLRPEDGEARTIRIGWDRNDLQRVLETSSGDTVTLAFDRSELEQAFEEADVEGHGLRQKAVILSVAVATAAAGSSMAQGAVVGGSGAPAGERGGPSVAQGVVAPGGERGGPSVAQSTGAAAADVAGYQRAMPSDYGATSGAVGAAGDQSPAEVTGGAGQEPIGGAVGAAGGEAPAAVTGGAGQPTPVGGAVGAAGDRSPAEVTGGAVPTAAEAPEAGGIDIPGPARDAAIAGGIALLITAAGFALRGRRIERPA